MDTYIHIHSCECLMKSIEVQEFNDFTVLTLTMSSGCVRFFGKVADAPELRRIAEEFEHIIERREVRTQATG